jgi:thermitase
MTRKRRLFVVLMMFAVVAALGAGSTSQARGPAEALGPYEPSTVLVGFKNGSTAAARSAVHARLGGVVMNRLGWLNVDVVRIPDGTNPLEVAARYERLAGVAYAEPNWIYTIESVPDDTRFGELWGLHNTGQDGGKPDADIDAPEGWDIAFGVDNFPNSSGLRVGILDTGIDQDHVELLRKTKACARATDGTGQITTGQCPDDNGHGTHVAGTIAARTDNRTGVAGVAPNSELAIFKGFDSSGAGFLADLVAGWHWLHTVGDAKVINHSWGGAPAGGALQAEATEAHKAGTLSIAAAGGCGCDSISYPAGFDEVISVPATDHNDLRASFSNFNPDTEIAAPGVNILSSTPGNGYQYFSGTSMATAHVTGAAALVRWKFGTDPDATRAILDAGVDDLGAAGRDVFFGFGRLNLAKALGGSADSGAIAGKVRKTNGNPLAGATVDCPGAGMDTTAADGSYSIPDSAPGNYTCTASKAGWHPKTKPVTVTARQTSILNFKLRRA